MRSLVLLLATLLFIPSSGSADDPASLPGVAQAIAQGDALFAQKRFNKALEAYHSADKLAHHSCAPCLLRIVKIERQLGDFPSALEHAKKAVKAAGDNNVFAAQAHVVRGSLLAQMSTKSGDKKLKESEEEFRSALALDPTQVNTRFNLGFVLLRQERDADGIAELKTFVAASGADTRLVDKAREVMADPVRAREPFSPDFSITTLDGTNISNATLRGKVVLLDFWGTWCPPCRESIPMLASIRKKFADRPFEIVGISSDNDEQVWKSFITQHRMDWSEYIDLSGEVLDAFDVHEFPTFIVLDRDGIIRHRHSGVEQFTAADLDSAINKALKRPFTPPATVPSIPMPSPVNPAPKGPTSPTGL
jgi:peroxiredoxin